MNNKVPHHMALSVELARKQRAKNRALLFEVRESFRSIISAIQFRALQGMNAGEFGVLAHQVRLSVDFIDEQLKEANDDQE